jgi:predicted N-acetyltransferase YhbS
MAALRPLVADDAAAAAALIRRAFRAQSVATDPPSSALRETTDSLAAAIAAGGGVCASIADQLVGVVLWSEQEQGLYFGRLAVDPDWRGKGIARMLIGAVEAEALRRRISRVHLSTRLVLLDNRRLFASCGFRETALRAHEGYAAPTFVVMEKLLPVAAKPAR